MIDPTDITKFDRTTAELEEFLLFALAVAGKRADTTAKNLDRFLKAAHAREEVKKWQPFKVIKPFTESQLANTLKSFGFGCYTLKARGFHTMVRANLDLKTCTLEDLKKIPGISFKTATFYLLHSRPNVKYACLDTHLLRWLRDQGHDVPKTSPQSLKRYMEIQELYLGIAESLGRDPAELDLAIWNEYSGSLEAA